MNRILTTKLDGKDTLRAPETAIILFLLMITFKTCNMPAVLYSAAEESGVWCIIIHAVLDAILTCVSLYVASLGGIQSKNIPKGVRKVAAALLLFFFLFKLSAFIYETTTSSSSVLFENSLIFPIFLAILISTAIIGSSGFTVIGRGSLIFGWLSIFMLVFNLFFVGFDGFGYNLFPALRFENVTKGLIKQAVWFGEPLILMTADLSKKYTKKQNALIGGAFAAASLVLIAFYLLLIYTYGNASKSVNNAFSRVLTMNKYSNELGAVDWPMIILWLIAALIHTSCLFSACKQCYVELVEVEKKGLTAKTIIFYILAIGLPLVFYFTVFDNVLYTTVLGSLPVGIITFALGYALPLVVAIAAFIKVKKIKKEEKLNEVTE